MQKILRSPMTNKKLYFPIFTLGLVLFLSSAEADKNKLDIPFRDAVVFNHFDPVSAQQKTIGLEVELGGKLSAKETLELLVKELGGKIVGERTSGTEVAWVAEGTSIGTIKVEPVNVQRILNRLKETSPNNALFKSKTTAELVKRWDGQFGQMEIVTEPLHYDQAQTFANTMDKLSAEGAKGTSAFGRLVSTQVNVGIDPKDSGTMKNLLNNYYSNGDAIREDIKPNFARKGYLGTVTPSFSEKLKDPNWHPDEHELFEWYQKNSPPKLARLNLFNALIMDEENRGNAIQGTAAKARIPRPVAEFREANTVFGVKDDPNMASRNIMREVDFGIAMTDAAKKTGNLNEKDEVAAYHAAVRSPERRVSPATPERPTFKETLDKKYYEPMEVRPIEGGTMALGNSDVLGHWGITGDTKSINQQVMDRYGVEVDNSVSPTGTRSAKPNAPFATAHNDGAGGIGDGRSMIFGETAGMVENAKGPGLTPYVIKRYSTFLGFHIGGVDGKASLAEGVRSLVMGETLHRIGIPSERVGAIIDNNYTAESELAGKEPSAVIVRELPGGGIRNSHLREWDKPQIRKGLDYLKGLTSDSLGRNVSDAAFVAIDAERSAQIAARLEDAYIVHGALTAGNILAYPGVVDLNTVTFLEAPDAEFTPIAQRSRYGNQTARMKELVTERAKKYAEANPQLKAVQVENIFDQAYRRESALLSMKRLGIPNAVAEATYDRNPALADEMTEKLWSMHTGHLSTDVREFQRQVAKKYAETSTVAPGDVREILDIANEKGAKRKLLPARREFVQKWTNKLKGRYSEVAEKEAAVQVDLSLRLINEAKKTAAEQGIPFDRKVVESTSREIFERHLPTNDEVSDAVKSVVEAKKTGGSMDEALVKVTRLTNRAQLVPGDASVKSGAKLTGLAVDQTHAARFSGDLVESERLMNSMRALTGADPIKGNLRLSNRWSTGNKQLVQEYLIDQLSQHGYTPRVETFQAGDRIGHNVIAEIKGTVNPSSVLEVVGHYDSANPLTIGADDNASGVSALLEMSRTQKKLSPKKTIRFVFSDLEEAGLLGSAAHVQALKQSGETLIGAIAVDTIAHKPAGATPVFDLVVGKGQRNKQLGNAIMHQLDKYTDRPLKAFPLTIGSIESADHGSYVREGLPAVFVRENYESFVPGYHTPEDNLTKINEEYFRNVVGNLNESVSAMAESNVPHAIEAEYLSHVPAYAAVFNKEANRAIDYVGRSHPMLALPSRFYRTDKKDAAKRWKRTATRMYNARVRNKPNVELDKAWDKDMEILETQYSLAEKSKDPAEMEKVLQSYEQMARKWDRNPSIGCAPANVIKQVI